MCGTEAYIFVSSPASKYTILSVPLVDKSVLLDFFASHSFWGFLFSVLRWFKTALKPTATYWGDQGPVVRPLRLLLQLYFLHSFMKNPNVHVHIWLQFNAHLKIWMDDLRRMKFQGGTYVKAWIIENLGSFLDQFISWISLMYAHTFLFPFLQYFWIYFPLNLFQGDFWSLSR